MKRKCDWISNRLTANPAVWLYRCTNHFGARVTYVTLPFIAIALFYFALIAPQQSTGVPNTFSFFDDYANSIAFVYLLPISFIFGGYYFDYSLKIIEGLLENCKQDRDIINRFKKSIKVFNRLAFILEVISIAVACVIAWNFSHVFKKVDTVIIWSNELPACKQLAYQIILFLVWCFSLQLGCAALIDCLKLGALLNNLDNFRALHNHYDNCLGYGKCAELVVGHVGLAIYFFLGLLLVIISDFINANKFPAISQYFLFANKPLLVLAVSLFSVMIFAIVTISYVQCREVVHTKKKHLLEENMRLLKRYFADNNSEAIQVRLLEREEIQAVDDSLLKPTVNKMILICSAIVPIIGIVIQLTKE